MRLMSMAMFSCSLYVGTMIEYLTPSAMPPPFCFRSLSFFLVVVVVVVVVGIRLCLLSFSFCGETSFLFPFFPSFLLSFSLFSLFFPPKIEKRRRTTDHTVTHTEQTSYSQACFKISSQYLDARTNALSRSTHQLIQNDSNRILTVRFRP